MPLDALFSCRSFISFIFRAPLSSAMLVRESEIINRFIVFTYVRAIAVIYFEVYRWRMPKRRTHSEITQISSIECSAFRRLYCMVYRWTRRADSMKNSLKKCASYLKEFTETTTLHGIRYLSMWHLHFTEISIWIGVFLLSTYGACTMIANSWQRYNANPTVIAIQKNYREWNITFPAATFCFLDNVDEDLAKNFIQKTWNVTQSIEEYDETPEEELDTFSNDTTVSVTSTSVTSAADVDNGNKKYTYYLKFLKDLVNTTYESLNTFEEYVEDDTVNYLDVEKTIMEVLRIIDQKSTVFNKEFKNREFLQTLTEMGVCYTHAGILSDYITISNVPNVRKDFESPTCNFLNTLCYARTEGIPSDVRYYVHSPFEIPDISSAYFPVYGRMDRDTSFTVLETTVSPEIYRLNPSQRQCRFMFESEVPHLPVYSFNLCRMECRKKIAFNLCGCAPYFYQKERGIPVCGIKGLACLAKHSEMLITLRTSDGKKLKCDCLPQCMDNKYFVDREVVRQWSFPVPYDIRFRWAIEKFSKIRLRRDVIFSFEDLVVSFGGTAAFFLGCSVLSFVEIIYFFTLRLIWYITSRMQRKHE